MEKKSIPKFYGLRIYMSSVILYFFLVIPFISFIIFQNVPTIVQNNPGSMKQATIVKDSILSSLDTLPELSQQEIDSIVNMAIRMAGIEDVVMEADSLRLLLETTQHTDGKFVVTGPEADRDDPDRIFAEQGPFSRYFLLLFTLLFISFLVGLFYNRPFKRFFKLKRRKKEIPDKLQAFCKKHLLRTPVVNSVIVTMPNIVVFVYSWIFLLAKVGMEEEVEKYFPGLLAQPLDPLVVEDFWLK